MNQRVIRSAAAAVAVAVAVLAAAAVWLWYTRQPEADPDQLDLYGNVDIRQVSLAFNATERIAELRVREGDRVRAGDVLGVLDTRTARLRVAQAQALIGVQEQALGRLKSGSRPEDIAQVRANVAAAEADAELAGTQVMRLRSVHQATAGRGVSQQDIDNALSRQKVALSHVESARMAAQLVIKGPRKEDIAQARSQLQASRVEEALTRRQLEEAELKAPVDAVVRARLMEVGDMASAQRPVYTLAITQPKWVRAYVSEVRLGRLVPGMSATVTTDSRPGENIPGRVGTISSVAEFTPKTVQTEELRTSLVYEVRVLVDDPRDTLRLGMPATVHLRLQPLAASAPARP